MTHSSFAIPAKILEEEERPKNRFLYYENIYTGKCLPIFAFVVFLMMIIGAFVLLGVDSISKFFGFK